MKVPVENATPVVPRTLRILIADDHELVRKGLRSLLQAQSEWSICAEAMNGAEAVEKVRRLRPDIVVLDIHMPVMDGLEAAGEILRVRPETRVLILTVDESAETTRCASEVGAHGIVMKSDAARDLIAAVSALSRRESFYTAKVSGIMSATPARHLGSPTDADDNKLTKRERDVVVLVAKGYSSKEIAAMLNISASTVAAHRANLMHKLGLQSKAELVRFAIRSGLVSA